MKITDSLEKLVAGKDLTQSNMQEVMLGCMQGKLEPAQLAAFLALMRLKGETSEELIVAIQTMQQFAHHIDLGSDLVDIVGTGGDGKNTFNVSTVSAIVAASAGARVAKHGSYSSSGKSGSADLLERAGFTLKLRDEQLKECMQLYGLCYLFGPQFHQALQQAQAVRKQLGIRTFFNLIAPLLNPANVKRQVIGVYDKRWQKTVAEVLAHMGSEHALVVCSEDGMDEISIAAPTLIIEYHKGKYKEWVLDPRDYDCYHPSINDIVVHSSQESFEIVMRVLRGEKGPARDIVLLNTAAALYCAGLAKDIASGITKAATAIDRGAALDLLIHLRQFTQA